MKSVGGYHDWPYYASNLSAFAAPFSVNPYTCSEVSSHPVGSAESTETVPPLHFQSYGYDFFSGSIRELDSTAQFSHLGLPSYPARSSLVEAQPYYVSSAIHDHTVAPFHGVPSLDWPSLGEANKSPELGFSAQSTVSWDQFPEFNNHGKGKQVGVGTALSSKETNSAGLVLEERMHQNQGNQELKDPDNSKVSHIIDWENYNVPSSANRLHDSSSWWGTIKPMPVEFPVTSVVQSPSMSLETHHEVPLKVVADSGNNQPSNIGSYDNHSRHGDKPLSIDTVSSMPRTGLLTDLNVDDIIADEHTGHNNFYNTEEASLMPSPGTGRYFDSGHIRMHLGRNEPSSSKKAMIADNNVSRDVDFIFRGRHGFQNPHTNLDNLSLRLTSLEDVLVETSQGGDRCNPGEDSPCWKGASAAHLFHFEPPAALPQEYVDKKESSFGSVIQEPQNYLLDTQSNMKKTGENPNGYQMHICQEISSAGSPRKFSVTKFASEDRKSGSAMNVEPFQSQPSCNFGLQYLDVTKMKENNVLPAKPSDCESRSSYMEHQVVDTSKLMSQKQRTPCIGEADGCNANKCMEYGSSHTAEHTLPSPCSAANTASTSKNSAGKVSPQKLNVQMLVDTMQNLSEMLLYHCLNDTCELKERDCNVIKNVISNLNTCALKNAEQTAATQQCLFYQPETLKDAKEPHESHQNTSFKRPQLTKIGPESFKVELRNPLATEANLHFRSEIPHWKLSDTFSLRDDTEMKRADDMTKDLKKILSKNFHHDDEGTEPQTVLYKNLWLEAEAALCSVYYRARYNQIKIEMDKHSYKEKVEMEKQSKSEVVPSLSQSQSSVTTMHNYPNSNSSALKLPFLDATKLEELATSLEELSRLNFSPDMNKPNAMTSEGKGGQNLDSFIDNYLVPCSDDEAERNDKSSVMARYQVLKARADHHCIDTTNLEEQLDIADKSSPREKDKQKQVDFCQDSPIPEKNSTDYEESVVARFRILKSRLEGSSSISSEGQQLDGVGSAGKETDDTTIAKNVSEGKSSDVHVNLALVHLDSTAMDKSIPKEFHLDLEDKQDIEPCGTCEFQLPTYCSDGFASDWEHVEKGL